MRSNPFRLIIFVIILNGVFAACQKSSDSSKPTKVIVELQVGYLPNVSTTSHSINFYYTRSIGKLYHEVLPNKPYFDSAYAIYMKSGDSLKMVDPHDSLYGVFLIGGANVTSVSYNGSGSLVYYYVKP